MNWIELHTDTSASEQLSFLDGPQIVSLCANNGCTAVACTDRNSILSWSDTLKPHTQGDIIKHRKGVADGTEIRRGI